MCFCRLQLWWNPDENWYWSFKVLTFDILLFQWSFVRDSLYLIIYILFKRMWLFLILLNRITKVKHHFVFLWLCGYHGKMPCIKLECAKVAMSWKLELCTFACYWVLDWCFSYFSLDFFNSLYIRCFSLCHQCTYYLIKVKDRLNHTFTVVNLGISKWLRCLLTAML